MPEILCCRYVRRSLALSIVCLALACSCSDNKTTHLPDDGGAPGEEGSLEDGGQTACIDDPATTIIRTWASVENPGFEADLTLDGILSDSSVWSAEGDNQWIAYELSRETLLDHVRFAFFADSVRIFDVQLSNDGENWTDLLVEQSSQGNMANIFERFDFEPTCARYLRFVGHGSNVSGRDGWNAITETDIHGYAVALNPSVCGDHNCTGDENCMDCAEDCGPCTDSIVVVYHNSFEQDDLGDYTAADMAADWTTCYANTHSSIISDSSDTNPTRVFRHYFPQGSWSLDGNENGFRCFEHLAVGYDELYLTYRVKFGDGFDAVQGGKLPRLISGEEGAAGTCPDGTDFFTGGMMFKKHDSGVPMAGFYLYHPEQWNTEWYREAYFNETGTYPTSCQDIIDVFGGAYGSSHFWTSAPFTPGQWYTITERIVANTPGSHDGLAEGFVDGQLVIQVTDLRFRDIADLKIGVLEFVSFFGGGDSSWATTREEYIYFDDIMAFYFTEDSGQVLGNQPSAAGRVLPALSYPTMSPIHRD